MNNLSQECIEIWKDVPEYEGLYQVSNMGRVKSLPKEWVAGICSKRYKPETIMSNRIDSYGYCFVTLCKNKAQKNFKVHRLVYETFVGKTNLSIDHIIENNKADNRLSNLQALSVRENTSKYYLSKGKSSKYTGVFWNKTQFKWTSKIKRNGKVKYLGSFINELDAHHAYQDELNRITKLPNY